MSDADRVELVRLSEIDTTTLSDLFNDRRVRRHMPLAQEPMSKAEILDWVKAKESYWDDLGFGPWGIRISGVFAGWGGLQPLNDGRIFLRDIVGFAEVVLEVEQFEADMAFGHFSRLPARAGRIGRVVFVTEVKLPFAAANAFELLAPVVKERFVR